MSSTTTLQTGAVRSSDRDLCRYDLVPYRAMRRIAMTFREGAAKYEPGNWEKGMPIDVSMNHLLAHAFAYLAGDRSEDHLGHIGANCMFAIDSEERWHHLNGRLNKNIKTFTDEGDGAPQYVTDALKEVIERYEAKKESRNPGSKHPAALDSNGQIKGDVYISGPMSGIENNNFPEFEKAAQQLEELGLKVVSPHRLGEHPDWTHEDYMRRDIGVLMTCSHMVMLSGWSSSCGARAERDAAAAAGIQVWESMSLILNYVLSHPQ